MPSNRLLSAATRGMLAGAAGTIAMTLSQRLEMSISGREASKVPGQSLTRQGLQLDGGS